MGFPAGSFLGKFLEEMDNLPVGEKPEFTKGDVFNHFLQKIQDKFEGFLTIKRRKAAGKETP